jgi:hypothetical protein
MTVIQSKKESLQDIKWWKMYNELLNFKGEFGHANPILSNTNYSTMAKWVKTQRYFFSRNMLSNDRIQKLNEIGFIWSISDKLWEEKFNILYEFYEKNGHLEIPKTGEYTKLNSWCYQQRNNKNQLSEKRKNKLDKINFIWNTADYKWEKSFKLILEFKNTYGHCRVPQISSEHKELSAWCNIQKLYFHKGLLDNIKIEKLNSIGFYWFENKNVLWEKRYNQLIDFKNKFGHFKVPRRQNAKDKYIEYKVLSNWISTQRYYNSIGKLQANRKSKLDEIDFIWVYRQKISD